jgi:hypothetical protein
MIDEADVEAPRKRGRPRTKVRTPILSPEQVLGLLTPEQIAEKERLAKDATRKRTERQKAAAEKAIADIETKEDLWQHNRKLLSETELTTLLEKQERVFDQVHWANSVLSGTNLPEDDPDYVSVEEGAADLLAFVRERGTVTMELVLIDQYWKTPLYTERFQGSDPTSIFARLGLVTAMPGHKVYQFEQLMAARRTATQTATAPSGNGFVTMRCACGSFEGERSVHVSIADHYRELGKTYQCHRCRNLEHKSRAESTIFQTGRLTSVRRS